MEKGSIYKGKAPEPVRKISLGTSEVMPGDAIQPPMINADGVQVGDAIYAIPDKQSTFNESPTPTDPEEAVKVATTEDRIGELTRALGEQKRLNELALQEMSLKHESQMAIFAAQAGQPDATSYLPQGVSPDQNVKAGELMTILQGLMPHLEEKIARSGWDVTPEEEGAVLADNPHFTQITDGGKKIEMILKAVHLRRARNGSTKTTPGSTSSPQTPRVGASNIRPMQRTVPHVEGSTSPIAPDLTPVNPAGDIAKRYEEAKNIPDKTLRLATMKKVYKESQAAQGITDEVLAKTAFVHSV